MAKDAPKTDLQFFEQFEPDLFWEQHSAKIMGVVLAVVLIGLGIYLWQRHATDQKRIATERLAAAQDEAALQALVTDYPGQEVAAQAELRLADLDYQHAKYDQAATEYQRYLEKFSTHAFVPTAQLGLAAVREAQGSFDAAKKQYEQLTALQGTGYVAASAKLGAARCAEALGQKKEARQLYEEAMALSRDTPLHTTAYLRWTVLGRDLPAAPAVGAPLAPAPAVSLPPGPVQPSGK